MHEEWTYWHIDSDDPCDSTDRDQPHRNYAGTPATSRYDQPSQYDRLLNGVRFHETEVPNYCALQSYAVVVPQFKAFLKEIKYPVAVKCPQVCGKSFFLARAFLNPCCCCWGQGHQDHLYLGEGNSTPFHVQ